MMHKRYLKYMAMMAALTTGVACSVIDEDMEDCGNDFKLVYELRLITNLTTELTTELNATSDQYVASALKDYLKPVFTDFAHDVDLSFFDVNGDSAVLHHEEHIMDANQTSYTLYLPVRQYMHTAVANVVNNGQVSIRNNDRCHTGGLKQVVTDTITPHSTGLFTARLPMNIQDNIDQTFYVHLYMANCAMALVLDTTGVDVRNIEVYTSGFATDYLMCDSVYSYERANSTYVHADHVPATQGKKDCFCTVNYPSPEAPLSHVKERTRLIIETEEPFLAEKADDALWKCYVYVTLPNGSVTRTELFITLPLRAGQLKIIQAHVYPDGSVRTNENEIGTSVTLNWQDGLVIE
ncbi:MAG: FimB/Mfa2 family fimbrial subunit [Bacteroidaceae bacterium]|nr:FimB/Mfa2 family fimbrial subunit [Bacteroidaceae bacterium]